MEEHPKHYTKLDLLAAYRFGRRLHGDGRENPTSKENEPLWGWLISRIEHIVNKQGGRIAL